MCDRLSLFYFATPWARNHSPGGPFGVQALHVKRAYDLVCHRWSQTWPPITLPGTSSKDIKGSLKFMFSRMSRTLNDDDGEDEEEDLEAVQQKEKDKDTAGVLGQAVITAFKSSKPDTQSKVTRQPAGVERQLSGSDVLRALQKASIQKSKKPLKKKSEKKGNNSSSSQGAEQPSVSLGDNPASSHHMLSDVSNEGPLGIKGEWGARLDELERRLRDIMMVDV